MKSQQIITSGCQSEVINILELNRSYTLYYIYKSLDYQFTELNYFLQYHRPGVVISLSGTTCSGKKTLARTFQLNHPNSEIIDIKNLQCENDDREDQERLEERLKLAVDTAFSSRDVLLCNLTPEVFLEYLEKRGVSLPIFSVLVFCPFFELEERVKIKNEENECSLDEFRDVFCTYNEYSKLYVTNSCSNPILEVLNSRELKVKYCDKSKKYLTKKAEGKFVWPHCRTLEMQEKKTRALLFTQPYLQEDFEGNLAIDNHFGSYRISSKKEYSLVLMNNNDGDEDVISSGLSQELYQGFLQFLGSHDSFI